MFVRGKTKKKSESSTGIEPMSIPTSVRLKSGRVPDTPHITVCHETGQLPRCLYSSMFKHHLRHCLCWLSRISLSMLRFPDDDLIGWKLWVTKTVSGQTQSSRALRVSSHLATREFRHQEKSHLATKKSLDCFNTEQHEELNHVLINQILHVTILQLKQD